MANSFSDSRDDRAVVGSSMTRILELACTARQISTICCSAIDSEPTGVRGVKVAPSRCSTPSEPANMAARSMKPPRRGSRLR